MAARALEDSSRGAARRGPALANGMLRAQRSIAGSGSRAAIRLVYIEGRTVYFVLSGALHNSAAQLARLGRLLALELGFEPILEELSPQ
jgi:hypothetical protein